MSDELRRITPAPMTARQALPAGTEPFFRPAALSGARVFESMQSISPSHSFRRIVSLANGARLALFATDRARDKQVALKLAARLERNLSEAGISDLAFYVRDGMVTIAGPVGSITDKRILMALILQVEGVASVEHRDDVDWE